MNIPTSPAQAFAPGTTLTFHEIADLLGHNLKTIRNWNDKGAGCWPNAVQDSEGRKTWRVPVTDLVAAGNLDAAQVTHVENELADCARLR